MKFLFCLPLALFVQPQRDNVIELKGLEPEVVVGHRDQQSFSIVAHSQHTGPYIALSDYKKEPKSFKHQFLLLIEDGVPVIRIQIEGQKETKTINLEKLADLLEKQK